jgi:hypothetical protein
MKSTLVLMLLALLAGCHGDEPGQWAAIVYPDGRDRSKFETTYGFQTHTMCKRAALESIAALADPSKADYRCGHVCNPDPNAPGHPVCQSVQK